jgi:hypothetical protein
MQGEMQVRLLGQACAARIDDDQASAALLRFLDVRDQVDARDGGVHAPHDDEVGVGVVLVGDPRHLPVQAGGRAARRGGANRSQQPRRAEAIEEARVRRILREIAVRSAVGEREDSLPAAAFAHGLQARRHEPERLIPRRPAELPFTLAARADARVRNPGLPVQVLRVPPDLGANVAARDRVLLAAADGDDSSVGHRDVETAGVGAIEGTGALDVDLPGSSRRAHACQPTMRSTVSTPMGW